MPSNPQHPGLAWRAALETVGQSQSHTAKALGCSTKHLNQVLQGHALPSATLTLRFAQHVAADATVLWHAQADYTLALARQGRGGAPRL